MATTIRVSDRTRQALERARARLTLATGRRLTLDEVVESLIEDQLREQTGRVDGERAAPDDPWARLFALQRDWGATVPIAEYDAIAGEDPA